MKVLFVAPNLAAGGAERQLSLLLPGLRERGFDARLIALDGGGPFEQPLRDSDVPLEVLGMRHQADIRPLVRSELVRRFRPDAVVSTCGPSALYVGCAIARWRRTAHAYIEHLQVGLTYSRRREAMVRLIARRVDLVIAVSPLQGEAWRQRGFPEDRIIVVENGVEAPRMNGSKLELRRELGIPASAVVALLAARLRPEKRVPDFVHAVAIARKTHPELVGLIAGEGPDRSAVERALASTGDVQLLGHRDDVPSLMAAADIFVLVSDFEAVPMAILEAMAVGLPVVATDVGGIPDLIGDGEAGVLVPPRDPSAIAASLVMLARDPALRASLGTAAAGLHRRNWTAEKMIEAYARVLGEMRREPSAGSVSRRTSVPGTTNRKL